jgi:hypothetical protein
MVEPDDPVRDDETVLRRVPEAQMNLGPPVEVAADAFDPHKARDVDGLSVYRSGLHTPQQVASFRTKSTKQTWVAELSASRIRELGLTIEPKPLAANEERPAQPGHAVIPELNAGDRKKPAVDQWKQQLVALVQQIHGPFPPCQ